MTILIALVPALLWGCMPLIITKLGGTIRQQTVGITMGALFFACIAFFFTTPSYTPFVLLISFLTGGMFTVGQMYQLKAFKIIGVSKAMPISTGMQLVGTALGGVVLFGEWNTMYRLVLGFIALLLITLGVFFTAYVEKQQAKKSGALKAGIIALVISSLGYVCYVITIQGFAINATDAILPQSIGMVITAVLMTLGRANGHADEQSGKIIPSGLVARFGTRTLLLMIPGIFWAGGNIVMIYANSLLGVATGFSLSQLCVIISTLGAIILFKEEKTKKELTFVIGGVMLVALGGILIGLTKL